MKKLNEILTLSIILISTTLFGQNFTQTLRGTIIDADNKTPIPFAKVTLVENERNLFSKSNDLGEFRFDSIPLGRISLKIEAQGYQLVTLENILLESGKEKIVNIEMQNDVQQLGQVEIKAQKDKSEAINKMATVSAKTFTVEETNRYSGTLNDPSRMVASFAGVVGNAEGDNDIVVRGNSPRGILWRLEGIDIPNPNHFGNNGSTGGPVNMLNGSMLANSDFFSGAFSPEYGNALSGVFDVKFRQGNNEKREYSFSAGVIGLDGSLEGPFKEGYKGSYLVNYRYSSIALLDGLGILDFDGIPKYQDASFNIKLPTKRLGSFAVVGLGGMSKINVTDKNDTTNYIYNNYDVQARMGVVALKHHFTLTPKSYLKSFVSVSTSSNGVVGKERDSNAILYNSFKEFFTENNLKFQTIYNFQANKKNTIQLGGTYTHLLYDLFHEEDKTNTGKMVTDLKSKGKGDMIQSFVSWKYRINNELTMVSGVNHTHFFVNDHAVIEPRFGLKWQQSPQNDFSIGFGMHSRLENLFVYQNNILQEDGTYFYPNKNLDFTKSIHYVLGYGRRLTQNLRFKTELYYQHLYNLPVENDVTSNFSLTNFAEGTPNFSMVNKGTGTNYGIELTLERYFANNFYFLMTSSLYNSTYKTLKGEELNTRYNGNYVFNILGGKEFLVGKSKNKTIGINAKIALMGGNRYTPIDLEASITANETRYKEDQAWKMKSEAVFIPNFGVTYRVNKEKVSHSFKLDIQNINNNQAKLYPFYNERTKSIDWSKQLPFIPNLIYTLKF